MSNSYYNSTFTAAIGTLARSSTLRSQFTLVETGITAMEAALATKASPTFTGTTMLADVSYTGTLTGGAGVLDIGSGQIHKNASGLVGIGTGGNSYFHKVTMYTPGAAEGYLQAANGPTGLGASVGLLVGLDATGKAIFNQQSAFEMVFSTSNTNRVRIKASGGVVFTPMAAPSSPEKGEVYYDSGTDKHYGWNGSAWQAFY